MTEEQFEEYLNNPNKEFATAKEFQEVEKEYLNIVGYCKKVQQGIGFESTQNISSSAFVLNKAEVFKNSKKI